MSPIELSWTAKKMRNSEPAEVSGMGIRNGMEVSLAVPAYYTVSIYISVYITRVHVNK